MKDLFYSNISKALKVYEELKQWTEIKLFNLGECPKLFSFLVGFSEKYQLSVSLLDGNIDVTLVSLHDNKLCDNEDLGYPRNRPTKQFETIDELKIELLRLHNLSK